jgi:HPt (histidine-containing phosphotransfer) domain-containing protein
MNQNPNAEAEINALLAELWQRHLPSIRERLEILGRAAHTASVNGLEEPQRVEAQSVAHKLSGNLGMFGYPQAGSVAGEIEQILKRPTPETLLQLEPLFQQLRETLKDKF